MPFSTRRSQERCSQQTSSMYLKSSVPSSNHLLSVAKLRADIDRYRAICQVSMLISSTVIIQKLIFIAFSFLKYMNRSVLFLSYPSAFSVSLLHKLSDSFILFFSVKNPYQTHLYPSLFYIFSHVLLWYVNRIESKRF